MTDGQLLDRFVAGRDESAFESLVLRHGPMVLRICREVLDDPHDAEDAFQATFLALVRGAATIRERDTLGGWLREVARRVALRARVQAGRRRLRERPGLELMPAVDDPEPGGQEIPRLIHSELERLPEKFRAPLVLCYLEGRTQEDAARQLRCPVGTLKSRLTKARDLLRSRLDRRGLAVGLALLMAWLEQDARAELPDELVESTVRAAVRRRPDANALPPAGRSARSRGKAALAGLLVLVIAVNAVHIAGRVGFGGHVRASEAMAPPPAGTCETATTDAIGQSLGLAVGVLKPDPDRSPRDRR